MELRQLTHFLAVLDAGSLTAGSSQVGLTQQALSRSIARLEDQVGGKLFERESRGMVPTRLGVSIAEHARQIVAESSRLRHTASAELGLERGRLIIGLSPIAAASMLGEQVMRFAVDHPNVRIDVESGIDRDFSAALHRGELDMAISGQLDGQVDRILLDQLVVEEWGVVGCATNARLTEAKELKDLLGMQWIIGRNTTALDIRIAETFADAGMPPPRPGIMTTSVLFTLNALRHSDYLAILPQSLCQTIDGLQWRNMSEGAWNTPIYLMRRKRALTDDLLRAALRVFNVAT